MPQVPRFLVGCKKDLRYDAERIGELMKEKKLPVTPEEVRDFLSILLGPPVSHAVASASFLQKLNSNQCDREKRCGKR